MVKQTTIKCTRLYYDTGYTDGNVNDDDIYKTQLSLSQTI